MLARNQTLMLRAEDLTCPAAKAALRFAPLPERELRVEICSALLLSRPLHDQGGRGKDHEHDAEHGARVDKGGDRWPPQGLPFDARRRRDRGLPEQVMWLCLASICKRDGKLSFNSSIFQCCCADVTVVPYLTGEVNISPGCYGCREATDVRSEHMLMGILAKLMHEIAESLEFL